MSFPRTSNVLDGKVAFVEFAVARRMGISLASKVEIQLLGSSYCEEHALRFAMQDFASVRDRMVELQIARRGVRDRPVLDAMRHVPRELFVEPGFEEFAYEDGPLPIGEGQTISQPYIVALMLEAA